MTSSKNKILVLAQLPPPKHGASAVNESIKESRSINSAFQTWYVDLSPSKDISDLGRFRFLKLAASVGIFLRVIRLYFLHRPRLVYLTLSHKGLAFYKDSVIAFLLKFMGANLVYHLHGKGVSTIVDNSTFKNWFYKLVFRGADLILLSPLLENDIVAVKDPKATVCYVPNGIAVPAAFEKESSGGKVTFSFLSNFVKSKGVENLIKAGQELEGCDGLDFEIKLIGGFRSKEFENRINLILAQKPSDKFNFTGPLYGDDKFVQLASSDVFVYPTENDCFPLVVLEAMSLGLPVIASSQGALPEMVDHGETGEILSDTSPQTLAAVMRRFIEDKEYRVSAGLKGKEKFLREYTQDKFEHNMVDSLNKIIARNSGSK